MEEFVGLLVALDLADETVLDGIIQEVDERKQILKLAGASTKNKSGERTVFPGILEVFGSDILNIELLGPDEWKSAAPPSPAQPSQAGSSSHRKPATDWTKEDVRRIKSEEFDFQSNLKLFDKRQIFSEIRSMDPTKAEDRLVSHNLSGRGQEMRNMQRKLLPSENVLGNQATDDEDDRILTPSPCLAVERKLQPETKAVLYTKADNLPVKLFDALEVPTLKAELYHATGKFTNLVVQNAGRSAAEHIVRKHNPASVFLRLGQNCRLDAIALCAARHLSLKGCTVEVFEDCGQKNLELYCLSAYKEQRAALSMQPQVKLDQDQAFSQISDPFQSVVIDTNGRFIYDKNLAQVVFFEQFCDLHRSEVLCFDPFIPLEALQILAKPNFSGIFLLDSGIPQTYSNSSLPPTVFRATSEVQLLP